MVASLSMCGSILNFALSGVINPDILSVTQKIIILHARDEKTQTYIVRINVLWLGVLSCKMKRIRRFCFKFGKFELF